MSITQTQVQSNIHQALFKKQKLDLYRRLFRDLYLGLELDQFIDQDGRLNTLKLSEELQVPSGNWLAKHVAQEFGDEALELLLKLMSHQF